ncbi:MAG: 1-acyl-sn-glycerol-3-phosphate acyltransferase [Spirochaetaceae bacterium]|nr:1-acyl-sn-glycerol-3-phosphate acyltransferase [Spirochaetaceae bacterium]|tara:strand:+ start:21147 stop:22430 length:1284 start_codon:yes stop_codon:yes gene_type:complete
MQAFIGPSFNLPLLWFADLLEWPLLKILQNIEEIDILPGDREKLRSLQDRRILMALNHPSTAEPPVTMAISKVMGSRFNFMASRQVFEWSGGLIGEVIRQVGAYSVIAGIADRESLKMSRDILKQKKGKLVIYPEGEPTSGENDSLMPFQPGAIQLGFWGLEDARKEDPNSSPVVLPAAVKYTIRSSKEEVRDTLESHTGKLEKTLKINPGNKNLLRRFLTIGRILLEKAEQEYQIPLEPQKGFDFRIGRLRHRILDGIADKFQIKNYDRSGDAIQKLRQVISAYELVVLEYPDPSVPRLSDDEKDWMLRETLTAFDFVVIKKDYLTSSPTPERFFEWLTRFETYVYRRKPRMIGGEPSILPRTAHVRFAPAFDLADYYSDYKNKKKATVENVTRRLKSDIEGLLHGMEDLTEPIVEPNDVGEDAID